MSNSRAPNSNTSRGMTTRRKLAAAGVLAAGLLASHAISTIWEEPPGDDAGGLPADSQSPIPVNSPLDSLGGSLGFDVDALSGKQGPLAVNSEDAAQTSSITTTTPDFEDMYRIVIDRPGLFKAEAIPGPNDTDFDLQLFLFDANGVGVLAADNDASGVGNSVQLLDQSNDGSGAMIESPGTYFLAVAGSGYYPVAINPFTGAPAPIFGPSALPDGEISGPDGPGGANPIIGWQGTPQVGRYRLIIDGARTPLTRCPADFTTTNTNPGDTNYGIPDGTVDGADLSFFVERWLAEIRQADVTTSNTNPGDTRYGIPDLTVDGADLSFYVELWLFGCNSSQPQ